MTPDLLPCKERYPLLHLESGLVRLRSCPGGHTVWMWRDDPGDFAFGGNKVRFYEYLIPSIIREKPDVLLTVGSLYSNHIRVSASVASLLGIECHILITSDDPGEDYRSKRNNLSLAASTGAKIVFAGSFAALLKLDGYKKELEAEGKKVFLVPNAGHSPGAVRAYAGVVAEAMSRLDGYSVLPERIFLPCASGTTAAGVAVGSAVLSSYGIAMPPVTVFAVGNSTRGAGRGITGLLSEASAEISPFPSPVPAVEVLDCGKNDYGRPDEELLELRRETEKKDGVLLDPTYNINAFYGMTKYLEAHPGASDVLYINTGGMCEQVL